jgi:hypothetical protein
VTDPDDDTPLGAVDEFAAAREPALAILSATPSPGEDESMAGALATIGSVAWTEGRVADSILLLLAAVTRSNVDGPPIGPDTHDRASPSPWSPLGSSTKPRPSSSRILKTSSR